MFLHLDRSSPVVSSMTGHDLEKLTPVHVRPHSWPCRNQAATSTELCRTRRQVCIEAQIWRRVQKLFWRIEGHNELLKAPEGLSDHQTRRNRTSCSEEAKIELCVLNVWTPGNALHLADTVPTVKHGDGSIMLWACFTYFLSGLREEILQQCRRLLLMIHSRAFVVQQSNKLKHLAKKKELFRNESVNVLELIEKGVDLVGISECPGVKWKRSRSRTSQWMFWSLVNQIGHLWKDLKVAGRRLTINLTKKTPKTGVPHP